MRQRQRWGGGGAEAASVATFGRRQSAAAASSSADTRRGRSPLGPRGRPRASAWWASAGGRWWPHGLPRARALPSEHAGAQSEVVEVRRPLGRGWPPLRLPLRCRDVAALAARRQLGGGGGGAGGADLERGRASICAQGDLPPISAPICPISPSVSPATSGRAERGRAPQRLHRRLLGERGGLRRHGQLRLRGATAEAPASVLHIARDPGHGRRSRARPELGLEAVERVVERGRRLAKGGARELCQLP